MKKRPCRVCGEDLYKLPLLVYKNMPAISQFLPTIEAFSEDKCVDLTICQCSKCGLIQLDNDPVFYFRDVIRSGSVSKEVEKFRTKQFQDFVDKYHLTGKKILEVGCGRGEYLGFMSQTGANAIGLENRTESVAECRSKGLNVVQGFLDDPKIKIQNGPFDAFYICNFLEHIDEPSKLLQSIVNNLKDDGIGFVEVPNSDLLLKEKCFYKFTLEHLLNFTHETLTMTLRMNGFEVLSCKPIRNGSPLSAIVRKRKPLNFKEFEGNQNQLNDQIKLFVNQFGIEKIAVWGAGHYTFGILSVVNISDKVKFIVDSAPSKQGKFSPKTHIPIVPPETLHSDPVKGIIVSAGGYSDEIIKIILENYSQDMKIAVVRGNNLVNVSPS